MKLSLGAAKKKKKVPEKKVPSLFGGDDDIGEEEGGEKGATDWRMKMQTNYKRKRIDDEQLEKAMQQDPSFAEYDEVYDSMKSAQNNDVKKQDVSSKYMETMIRRTESRKIEQEKITARVKRKEIEQEKELFGETEEFITPTYKKRLEEMEAWQKEQEVIDKRDEEAEYNAGGFLRKMLDDVSEGKSAAIQGSLRTSSASLATAPSSPSDDPTVKKEESLLKPIEEVPKKKPALVAGLNSRKSKEQEDEERQLEILEKERERRVKLEQEKKEKREQEREAKRRKKYERRNTAATIEEAQKRYFERKGMPLPPN